MVDMSGVWSGDDKQPDRRGAPVPGVYTFEVIEGEVTTHTDGTPLIRLRCQVTGGIGKGWRLFERLYFTEKARWFSKQKLKGLGVPEGLSRLEGWMFAGIRFRAVCKTEKSKPNDQGKVFDNLKVDIAEREGFHCGIQLVERGLNMPQSEADLPNPNDPLAQAGPDGNSSVPF